MSKREKKDIKAEEYLTNIKYMMYNSGKGNGAQTSYQSAEHDVGGWCFQLLSDSPTPQLQPSLTLSLGLTVGNNRVHTGNCAVSLRNLPSCQPDLRILVSDPWKQRQTRGLNQWKRKRKPGTSISLVICQSDWPNLYCTVKTFDVAWRHTIFPYVCLIYLCGDRQCTKSSEI